MYYKNAFREAQRITNVNNVLYGKVIFVEKPLNRMKAHS